MIPHSQPTSRLNQCTKNLHKPWSVNNGQHPMTICPGMDPSFLVVCRDSTSSGLSRWSLIQLEALAFFVIWEIIYCACTWVNCLIDFTPVRYLYDQEIQHMNKVRSQDSIRGLLHFGEFSNLYHTSCIFKGLPLLPFWEGLTNNHFM